MKQNVHRWRTFTPQIDAVDARHRLGFHNMTTGWLLCPCDLDWDDLRYLLFFSLLLHLMRIFLKSSKAFKTAPTKSSLKTSHSFCGRMKGFLQRISLMVSCKEIWSLRSIFFVEFSPLPISVSVIFAYFHWPECRPFVWKWSLN